MLQNLLYAAVVIGALKIKWVKIRIFLHNFLLCISLNMSFGCHLDGSFEYPQHMFG